jgi:hypothetical protein
VGLILYINGQQVDLDPEQIIAQTKQVNDLNSLENRQANYTNKFKVPKTAGNLRIMQFLSLTGNTSPVPYQENLCSLYSDNGECFIYNGRAVVSDNGDNFDITVYDGIIELFKKIENQSLSEIDLSDIIHTKNITTVKNSWSASGNLKYRYILADYNGKTGNTANNEVNIDYLVPSVNVRYIWDRIFEKNGFTYSGSVFDTEDFNNLWMTFPKGVDNGESEEEVFLADDTDVGASNFHPAYFLTTMSTSALNSNYIYPQQKHRHIKFKTSGKYRIEVTGKINSDRDYRIILGKNANGINNPYSVPLYAYIKEYQRMQEEITQASYTFDADSNDTFCVVIKKIKTNFHVSKNKAIIRIVKVNESAYDFQEALSEFAVKDFLKEVVHRFGLTILKDKYSNHYTFLTLAETLQNADNADWSDKFISKKNEKYVYGSYAQKNWFRYNYNDKESSFNDFHLEVPNVNLEEKKDLIKSKIYSPEKYTTQFLNGQSRVYKLWEKELEEQSGENESRITYKSLDKRYYFLKAMPQTRNISLYSEYLNDSTAVSNYYIESFSKLSFFDIIQQYYNPLRLMLNTSKVITAEFWLKDTDIVNFDFSKLYYIKQLSSYFLMNKINNYVPGKPTKCEMISILRAAPTLPEPPIRIYRILPSNNGYSIAVYYNLNTEVQSVTLQVFGYNGNTWSNWPYNNISPRHFSFTPTGNFKIRLLAGDAYSNEVSLTIPLTETIEI